MRNDTSNRRRLDVDSISKFNIDSHIDFDIQVVTTSIIRRYRIDVESMSII